MKHALLSPSSSHRWLACPGSVALSVGEPNPPSRYSDEGTSAHHLASETLTKGVNSQAFVGMNVGLWGGAEGDESECFELLFHPMPGDDFGRAKPPREFFRVDQEMASHVQTYVDKIREYAKGNELFVEQCLSIAHITGEEDATGTSDCVILASTELQVHDLKYGMGNKVFAKENPQLKIYALAALKEFGFMADFERVRLVIHQPRLDHLSEWDCSVAELLAWGEDVVKGAAYEALASCDFPRDTLPCVTQLFNAGEHCKTGFCPSRAKCPALAAYVADSVGASFEVVPEEVPPIIEMLKKGDLAYDLPTLGKKLKAVDIIESWCTAVRARVEAILIEEGNSATTTEALGYKLVQGRLGARAWVDAEQAVVELKKLRLKEAEMYTKKLISPTAAEGLLKKESPKKWEKIVPLYAQAKGAPSVALLDDKRPALDLTPVAEAFDDLDGSDLV